MSRYVFDIETNGLLTELTKIHSLVLQDIDHPECVYSFAEDEVPEGIGMLEKADLIVGHNSIAFDLPAIRKVDPNFYLTAEHRDTRVISQLIHADLKAEDGLAIASKKFDKENFKVWDSKRRQMKSAYGSHSLAAWGLRLGVLKGEYKGDFSEWSPEMQKYCEQDVEVTLALLKFLNPESYSQNAILLEHRVADLCARMEREGVPFDVYNAVKLQAVLAQRRADVEAGLDGLFPDWEEIDRTFIPKRDNKKLGYTKGVEVSIKKTVKFSPGSRDHIAKCLTDKYGWKPLEFTEKGKPVVNDEVLARLEYPEAKPLAEYFMLQKRLGSLAEGTKAWLKVEKNGLIHAGIQHNGTPHGRMAHYEPNISQVVKVGKPWGTECRRLFCYVPGGWILCGADMAGMQLRMLAHFLSPLDNGRYAKIVSEGDIHEENREAFGFYTRDRAKTGIYAFIFGGQAKRMAEIQDLDAKESGHELPRGSKYARGKLIITSLYRRIVGLKSLIGIVQSAATKQYLNGLDGRKIPIRSKHSALNYLVANADAVCCKDWMVSVEDELKAHGMLWGWDSDYVFLILNHDEMQIACRAEWRPLVEKTCREMAPKIGEKYKVRCPLKADFKTGRNWAETH